MRLTKRQLRRIIREEFSRLKRRGLIRESGRRRPLRENHEYMVAQAEEWIRHEGNDSATLNEFLDEMEAEGFDVGEAEAAYEVAAEGIPEDFE